MTFDEKVKQVRSVVILAICFAILFFFCVSSYAVLRASDDFHEMTTGITATVKTTAQGALDKLDAAIEKGLGLLDYGVKNGVDALENMQGDFRSFTAGMSGPMDRMADDMARNVEIFGGTNNAFRHWLGDPKKRTGLFETQYALNALLEQSKQPITDAGNLLVSWQQLGATITKTLTSQPFTDTMIHVDGITGHLDSATGTFAKWEKQKLDPDPYKGRHPFLHATSNVILGIVGVGKLVGEPAFYGTSIANGGK